MLFLIALAPPEKAALLRPGRGRRGEEALERIGASIAVRGLRRAAREQGSQRRSPEGVELNVGIFAKR